VAEVIARLRDRGVSVSLFLDPELRQIEAGADLKADAVELHTGSYALAKPGADRDRQLAALRTAGARVRQAGMVLHAGHGLNYHNVKPVVAIPEMHELNIGHSIVARAVLVGLQKAVREMKQLVQGEE
jgi:pyridoxine 5-phosphate synthase